MAKTLLTEISRIEREIHEIKSAARLAPMLRGFNHSFEVSSGTPTTQNNQILAWVITYEDGEQPILTEWISDVGAMFGPVVGSTQRVYVYSQYYYTATLMSTRKIISVDPA